MDNSADCQVERVGLSLLRTHATIKRFYIFNFSFWIRENYREQMLIRNSVLLPYHQAAYKASSPLTEKPQYYISLSRRKNSAPGKCLFFVFFNANLYVALISRRFSSHSSLFCILMISFVLRYFLLLLLYFHARSYRKNEILWWRGRRFSPLFSFLFDFLFQFERLLSSPEAFIRV